MCLMNQTFPMNIKKIIHDYLWKMQTWTLEEVRIFANSVAFFEEEVQIHFYQIMLKAYEKISLL